MLCREWRCKNRATEQDERAAAGGGRRVRPRDDGQRQPGSTGQEGQFVRHVLNPGYLVQYIFACALYMLGEKLWRRENMFIIWA